MNSIELKQLPIISHKAVEIGKEIKERIERLNIPNLVATTDTVKVLKEMRADLTKEYNSYETQRKAVKKSILAPYDEFDIIYKENISSTFTDNITMLKDKVDEFETMVKTKKKETIESYFNELIQSVEIDFVTFENLGLTINLSTSEKAYKEKVNEFVDKLTDDIELIKKHEFEAEIMAEFKKTLNASKSIIAVTDRKEAEKKEKQRIIEQEWSRRKSLMLDIAMPLFSDTNTFQFNDEIYVSAEIVRSTSKDDFQKLYIELEEKIKFENKKKEPVKVNEPAPPPKAEPLKQPEKQLPTVTARFECSATLPVLKELGNYMKSKGITYKNI